MGTKKISAVVSALKKCLHKKNKEKLNWLKAQDQFHWEKWLQIELAYELANGGGDVWMEVPKQYDNRHALPSHKVKNSNAFLDIVFREKNELTDQFNAIEIKMGRTEQGLKGVLNDLGKIRALRGGKNSWDFRSVTCVLVHAKNSEVQRKFGKIKTFLTNRSEGDSVTFVKGSYEFLVFGWEENQTKKMNKKEFSTWLRGIRDIYREAGVIPKVATKRSQKQVAVD